MHVITFPLTAAWINSRPAVISIQDNNGFEENGMTEECFDSNSEYANDGQRCVLIHALGSGKRGRHIDNANGEETALNQPDKWREASGCGTPSKCPGHHSNISFFHSSTSHGSR
jgi:hypothetical protein